MSGKGDTHNKISGGIFFAPVFQGRDITVQLPPEVTPALSGLPMGTATFAGRNADLRTLLEILAPTRPEVTAALIHPAFHRRPRWWLR